MRGPRGRRRGCLLVSIALLAAFLGGFLSLGTVLSSPGGASKGPTEEAPHGFAPSQGEGGRVDAGAKGETRQSGRSLQEEAADVLTSYRGRGDCALAEAGYLDLLGNVWSCIVQGDGWVDICVVRSVGEGSEVKVTHLDRNEWERDSDDVGAGAP